MQSILQLLKLIQESLLKTNIHWCSITQKYEKKVLFSISILIVVFCWFPGKAWFSKNQIKISIIIPYHFSIHFIQIQCVLFRNFHFAIFLQKNSDAFIDLETTMKRVFCECNAIHFALISMHSALLIASSSIVASVLFTSSLLGLTTNLVHRLARTIHNYTYTFVVWILITKLPI